MTEKTVLFGYLEQRRTRCLAGETKSVLFQNEASEKGALARAIGLLR